MWPQLDTCQYKRDMQYVTSVWMSLQNWENDGTGEIGLVTSSPGVDMHYSDVTVSAMASQITGISIVWATIRSGADQRKTSKLRVTGLCEGNPLGTGGFPPQRASNAKKFLSDDVIMVTTLSSPLSVRAEEHREHDCGLEAITRGVRSALLPWKHRHC